MISQNHYRLDLGGGTLTQFANRSVTQMMSYIIDYPDGDVIVIDGGMYYAKGAANLHSEQKKREPRFTPDLLALSR